MPNSTPPLESFDESSRPFVAALRGEDPDVRTYALQEIAPMVDERIARELLRIARDPEREPEERGKALIALGPVLEECSYEENEDGNLPPITGDEVWDPPLPDAVYREVHEELRRLYHDGSLPKLVRRRALEAAVRAPREWHGAAAATAWRADDPEWRVTAIFVMGHLEGFEEEIEEAFRGDDPELRRESMIAAAYAGIDHLMPEILQLAAGDTAPREDRLAAIVALGEHHAEGAEDLLRVIAQGRDEELAEAAEAALEEIGTGSLLEGDDLDFDLLDDDAFDDEGFGDDEDR